MLNDASDQRSSIENQIADTKQALEQRLVELDANEAERAEELAVCGCLKVEIVCFSPMNEF